MDTIKIKLGELKRIEDSINKLLNMRLPISISYDIGKALKKVSKELSCIENERNRLIKIHGEDQGEGNISIKDREKQKQFFDDMNLLLEKEIEIKYRPINIEVLDIKDSKGKDLLCDMTPQDMINLSEFFFKSSDDSEEEDEGEDTEVTEGEENVTDLKSKRKTK